MLVELNKKDLVALICGQTPAMKDITIFMNQKLGVYQGSYGRWQWDTYKLEKLDEDQLLAVHQFLKERR